MKSNSLPLRKLLQDQLSPMHQWLETVAIMKSLFSDDFEQQQYLSLLLAMKTVIDPLERQLKTFEKAFTDVGLDDINLRVQKTEWLEQDLNNLNLSSPPINQIPVRFLTLNSISAAAGALYVIEGSSMGALQITPQITKHFGDSAPTRFYRGYEAQTMSMWKVFCQWLDHTELDPHEAVLAGSEVFIKLRQQLSDINNR